MKRPLILLVEDNPSDEKLTLRAFGRCGVPHEMVVVRDGAEAIDWLTGSGASARRDPASPPALVLLDLKLPRIDGLEVIRRIRGDRRTGLVPIVVLTASREDEDLERCYALGANAYVRKPVDFSEFTRTAQTLATFWLVLNEPAPERRSGA